MLWMSVLDEAISRVTENPARTRSAMESQRLREREKRTRATPKAVAGNRDPSWEAAHALSGGQHDRAAESDHAGSSHQQAQPPRAAMQYLVSKNRHKYHTWSRNKTDESQQQHERSYRGCTGHEAKTLNGVPRTLKRRPRLRGRHQQQACNDGQET